MHVRLHFFRHLVNLPVTMAVSKCNHDLVVFAKP
jgi:hypothetical protein